MVTQEQWEKVADALSHPLGGGADFRIDGHDIKLRVVRRRKNLSYGIVAYVDGFVKGEYFGSDSVIGAKFYRPKTICGFTPKDKARLAKNWGKRYAAQAIAKATVLQHDCFFPSAESARRTWAKTCTTIELVRVGFERDTPVVESAE